MRSCRPVGAVALSGGSGQGNRIAYGIHPLLEIYFAHSTNTMRHCQKRGLERNDYLIQDRSASGSSPGEGAFALASLPGACCMNDLLEMESHTILCAMKRYFIRETSVGFGLFPRK